MHLYIFCVMFCKFPASLNGSVLFGPFLLLYGVVFALLSIGLELVVLFSPSSVITLYYYVSVLQYSIKVMVLLFVYGKYFAEGLKIGFFSVWFGSVSSRSCILQCFSLLG